MVLVGQWWVIDLAMNHSFSFWRWDYGILGEYMKKSKSESIQLLREEGQQRKPKS